MIYKSINIGNTNMGIGLSRCIIGLKAHWLHGLHVTIPGIHVWVWRTNPNWPEYQ